MPVALLVGRDEVLTGDAREVHAHLVVLEDTRRRLRACSSARRARTRVPRGSGPASRRTRPGGAGGANSVEATIGSQAAAWADRRRKASASFFENLAISAQVRSRSRYIASVLPSSNTDIMGGSGNTYLSPYFDFSSSSSAASSGLAWMKMWAIECWSCRKPGRVSSRVTTPPPNQPFLSRTRTRFPDAAR